MSRYCSAFRLPSATWRPCWRVAEWLGNGFALVLCCCLTLILPTPHVAAQTFATPEAAAADPDFAVQGEYSGNQRGMQVVARGDGEFEIVIYEGGLPGAGWDRVAPRRVDGDADVVADLVESMQLQRVVRSSPTLNAPPPPGAKVLFDGSPQSLQKNWKPGARRTEDGLLQEGATSIETFGDYTLHVEFRTPYMPQASGQGRGNSGVYHQGRYETQVLDSFGLKGANNETGGIYERRDPDLNMCFPPLQWQTYDVNFTAARYDAAGKKTSDARLNVRLNGVVVQPDVAVSGPTRAAPVAENDQPGPIFLQNHGNPVRFRNIWLLPRDADREAGRPRVPAFERFYASGIGDAAEGGHLLMAGLACTACHQGESTLPAKRGPDLTRVAVRVRPDHLLAMIADPHATKPGTAMPDPWSGVNATEKQRLSKAIASYLTGELRITDRPGDSKAAQRGEQLYDSIGCRACHDAQSDDARTLATSVPLGELDQKYTLESLTEFLLDPHAVRPGMRMPKLANDRVEARDLACYLLRDVVLVPGGERFKYSLFEGSWDKLPDFSSLKPIETGNMQDLDVAAVKPKSNFGMVFETYFPVTTAGEYTFHIASDDGSRLTIGDKVVVVHDGIHPASQKTGKIKLAVGVHPVKIEYFEKGGEEVLRLKIDGPDFKDADAASLMTGDASGETISELIVSQFRPDPKLVAEGAVAFQTQRCANCHDFKDSAGKQPIALTNAPSLEQLARGADKGCLAETPPTGVPNFSLSPSQRQAITAALATVGQPMMPQQRTHLTMAAMNCYACHDRNGIGGPETTREANFQTTTPEMGNEGRLPPSLTGVGDKLNDAYVATILDKGANERPYMKTRMPAFRYEPLKQWHAEINALDRKTEAAPAVTTQSHELRVSNGRALVGDKGLACIKCHTYDNVGVEGIRALDALRWPVRLREDWFHRYLMDPQKYRPGTRMPASFVDGQSALKTIYDGEPALQIDAIWKYLSSDNPKPPSGLVQGAIVLTPIDTPILYRNFITDLSPRGIAVGYPESVNLAWDAQSMGLVKIWQNEFIDASKHWVGRGPGNQTPLGDAVIKIDPDCPLAVVDSVDAPWPKESARERGYQFLGYRLNADKQPTFRYRFDGNLVEDFCRPLGGTADQRGFERTLKIENSEAQANRTFRAAVGNIEALPDGRFRLASGGVLTVQGAGEPQLISVDGQQELRFQLPAAGAIEITETIRW